MIKIIAQLILSLSVVELVPVNFASLESAHLSEANVGYPLVREVSEILSPSVSIGGTAMPPQKSDPASMGIITTAASAVVIDKDSGEILFEKNIDEKRSIGSITKLMTAIVFLESDPDLESRASIIDDDVRLGGRDHLYIDDYVAVRHLLEASLIGSDNPATMSLARLSGLSMEEFVLKMNELAKSFGMINSSFVDPTGLDSRNLSTAREVALLLKHALDYSEINKVTSQNKAEFTSEAGRSYVIPNTNSLLGSYLNSAPFSVVGGKTGFLPSAGYCLGLEIADGSGHEIFSIVLGSSTQTSRFQEVKGLAQWAFDTYTWPDEL